MLNILLLAVLISVTFYIIFNNADGFSFNSLMEFVANIHWPFLVAAFICMIMHMGFKGLSLGALNKHLGYKKKPLENYSYASADIYFSAITPSATGGQPASAYYMVKDGIPLSITTAILSFNLFMYTSNLIFVGLLAFLIRPMLFLQFELWVKLFIIAGFLVQSGFLAVYIMIIVSDKTVLRLAKWIISLLCFLHIFKDKNKYMERVENSVNRFRASVKMVSKSKKMIVSTFTLNFLERIGYLAIGVLVFFGAKYNMPNLSSVDVSVIDVFALETYAMLGAYCVPLPGAVGASEGIFFSIFSLLINNKVLLNSTMVTTRAITFYICFIFAGIVTLIHHIKVNFIKPYKKLKS